MINNLKEKNPALKVFSVFDTEFKNYGRVVTDFDASDLIKEAKKLELPEVGVRYMAGIDSMEALEGAQKLQMELYGDIPAQVGCCWGHNSYLNATEWHTGSEINVAVTPMVLLLAHLWEIEDGELSTDRFVAFYVPAGVTVEVYATTLHYTPCQVSDAGFNCVVGLPKGTNTALEEKPQSKYIMARNKWMICHVDNESAKNRGVHPGIQGENHKVNY